jgi:hypothetical protein
MNTTKHVVLLTSNIFGRGFDSRRLHHSFQFITFCRESITCIQVAVLAPTALTCLVRLDGGQAVFRCGLHFGVGRNGQRDFDCAQAIAHLVL